MLDKCFACERPTLGLEGQDLSMDSLFLADGFRDALKAGAFGSVHATCLISSPWGHAWAGAVDRHLQRCRPPIRPVGRSDRYVAYLEVRRNHLTLLRSDGMRWNIPCNAYQRAFRRDGLAFIPFWAAERSIEFLRMPEVAMELQGMLRRDGSVPLAFLPRRLGIADRLFCAQALDDGTIGFDASLEQEWSSDSVAVSLRYSIHLPDDAILFMQHHVSGISGWRHGVP